MSSYCANETYALVLGRAAARSGVARLVRLIANLSQREVAEHCGCTPASVSMWESGKTVPRGPAGRRYCELIVDLGAVLAADAGSPNLDPLELAPVD